MTARDGQEAAVTETTVAEVMAELAELEDPKTREVNEKHGDDHGVNLRKLRALAKRLKTQQELACQLWETDDTAVGVVHFIAQLGRRWFAGLNLQQLLEPGSLAGEQRSYMGLVDLTSAGRVAQVSSGMGSCR